MRIAFTRGRPLFVLALTLLPFGALPAADAALGAPTRAAGPPASELPATGSGVPDQIEHYVESGLLPRLADLYAPSAEGDAGIRFDDTTAFGPLTRVWTWTDEFLAGGDTRDPARVTNDWVLPVAVADRPVGLATVWINPLTDGAELAAFAPEAHAVGALAGAPSGALLVRDEHAGSWFALLGDSVTPLLLAEPVPGLAVGSGATLEAVQSALGAATPERPAPPPNGGALLAGLVLLTAVLASAAALLLPGRLRRRPGSGGVAPGPPPAPV